MMTDDPMVPTAPLEDFLAAMATDDNVWWRVSCGHHLNLFEAVCDQALAAMREVVRTRDHAHSDDSTTDELFETVDRMRPLIAKLEREG